jgi:Carbonic anhydrase
LRLRRSRCADSRIAPEYAFDSAREDRFVCRVARRFAADETVASMEYAVAAKWLNNPKIVRGIYRLRTGNPDAEVRLVMMLDLETEVEMKLPGRFKVSPQIAGAIKAVSGEVDVQLL